MDLTKKPYWLGAKIKTIFSQIIEPLISSFLKLRAICSMRIAETYIIRMKNVTTTVC